MRKLWITMDSVSVGLGLNLGFHLCISSPIYSPVLKVLEYHYITHLHIQTGIQLFSVLIFYTSQWFFSLLGYLTPITLELVWPSLSDIFISKQAVVTTANYRPTSRHGEFQAKVKVPAHCIKMPPGDAKAHSIEQLPLRVGHSKVKHNHWKKGKYHQMQK
jgi:hypothetical protein